MQQWDVIVVGAGAAGLFCAIEAAKRGRKTLVLDNGKRIGRKILMSGGGRCNFTNIYASPANLTFAETMAAMGGRVAIPTTMNAISVDRENWQAQKVPADFGEAASRLADAYVQMGARPTFTCAPYQGDDRPSAGEDIGWSESNAVIYANSVLGARSVKHPDFLDLFIALTGRAPLCGVYLEDNRKARMIIKVPFISIPNLVLGRQSVVELIQHDLNVSNIVLHLNRLQDNEGAKCSLQ